jgi:hypothetical protein
MKDPTITDGTVRDEGKEKGDAVAEMAAGVIRERSAAAQLVSESDILLLLNERLTPPDRDTTGDDISVLLTRLVDENEDLHSLAGAGSHWYYSSRSMTGAYGRILLQRLEGPVRLIAETVRHNASVYRRPVPLDMFMEPPFNLTSGQVLDSLATMAETEGFDDIATTTTSASGTYLYSTSYLETEHAVMLAEWFDVGQSENP